MVDKNKYETKNHEKS